jgi:hypothetical protein
VLFVLSANDCCAQTTEFTFVDNDTKSSPQRYQYSVIQAGDNFKFDTVPEYNAEFTMVVAKWHVCTTSAALKALAVALSFCRLLGLGCPKQACAKIATPRYGFRPEFIGGNCLVFIEEKARNTVLQRIGKAGF